MLRGASAARAVVWDRSAGSTTRTVREAPTRVERPVLSRVGAAVDTPSTVLRGEAAADVVPFVADRRSGDRAGRRSGDRPTPRLEDVYAAELARLRELARTEGWAAGHAEGLAEAATTVARVEAEAEARLLAVQQRWEARVASTVAALTAACAQVDATPPVGGETFDQLVLGATLGLVEEVLGRELAVAADPGADALRRALALSPEDGPTVVRLHPDDLGRIDGAVLAGLPLSVRLVGDPGVEPAGAVAETGVHRVDAQVGPALQRVRDVLGA
ncbi:flagellar assembly protein FliH [Klenkia marina]|uniref:Flagellar assembly protein FliH n=1 Tax=Klenkia marina TaxID=1960309 RepID=A0A1G4XAV2_9ACTN|nr:FliH/SctL family protein [Klenkia marina]SCX38376.1 flagellar assembly protein FliH [Klenkia marina]